jgi:hypothetical protein
MTPTTRSASPRAPGYPSAVSDPVSSSVPAGARPARPATVPGQKKKRHQRWTRIATWATVVGVVVFGAFGVWMVRDWRTKSQADPLVVGTQRTLDTLAGEVRNFVDKRGRLPTAPFELRAPDLPSTLDAQPWDLWKRPIQYRIVDADAQAFRLRSLGADGKPDTADDLRWPAGDPWE